jgi:hypothetical protein
LQQADTILGFNEPNHRAQDDMSPEEAAREWIKIQVALLVLFSGSALPFAACSA